MKRYVIAYVNVIVYIGINLSRYPYRLDLRPFPPIIVPLGS